MGMNTGSVTVSTECSQCLWFVWYRCSAGTRLHLKTSVISIQEHHKGIVYDNAKLNRHVNTRQRGTSIIRNFQKKKKVGREDEEEQRKLSCHHGMGEHLYQKLDVNRTAGGTQDWRGHTGLKGAHRGYRGPMGVHNTNGEDRTEEETQDWRLYMGPKGIHRNEGCTWDRRPYTGQKAVHGTAGDCRPYTGQKATGQTW